jgi:hypothetical protein
VTWRKLEQSALAEDWKARPTWVPVTALAQLSGLQALAAAKEAIEARTRSAPKNFIVTTAVSGRLNVVNDLKRTNRIVSFEGTRHMICL